MDLYWHGELKSPKQPGLYMVPEGRDLVLVRQRDIEQSERFNGEEIRCSCIRNVMDSDGNGVYVIERMAPHRGAQVANSNIQRR